MRFSVLAALATTLALPQAFAAPVGTEILEDLVTVTQYVDSAPTAYNWAEGWVKDFPIHSSCNATESTQIRKGLKELKVISLHARDHVLRFGNSSDHYIKYFGSAAAAEVVGWYDRIVSADKTGVLFRCDDIDGNCHQDGWAGHWRGENATDETVICPLSYTSRKYLSQMCSQGYTVANSPNSGYWATDLMHRVFHTTSIGEDVAGHYADTYAECLELAIEEPEKAVRNSATLRLFALDVYAYDITVPGEGCTGKPSAVAAVSSTSKAATTTAVQSATPADNSGKECHTHADGVVHCS
ncbi:zincin [Nadsonia fulvescens var. elongata DSM 6958]|uniref:Zincin n=1 Tax=Nadsonia fulvescens var. elongata DSM 6958 TaxID=857566 RepID=A0A1E3PPW5_9ASCO|nr:zincin [Nadsonia fulvescens var. elongata DSM 6958]